MQRLFTAASLARSSLVCPPAAATVMCRPPRQTVCRHRRPGQSINILGINGAQSFSPNPSTVSVGQTVVWHNLDTATHRVVLDDGSSIRGTLDRGPSARRCPHRGAARITARFIRQWSARLSTVDEGRFRGTVGAQGLKQSARATPGRSTSTPAISASCWRYERSCSCKTVLPKDLRQLAFCRSCLARRSRSGRL